MKRVRNLAEVDDLVKIIRGNSINVDLHRAMGSVEHVAQNYKSFFADCIQVTPRLSRQQLTQALSLVHPTSCKTEVSQFAGSLVLAFGHIRQKGNVVTSGVRTDPVVMELSHMLQQRKPTLGSSLKALARTRMQASPVKTMRSRSSSSQALLPIKKQKHPMQWSSDEECDWELPQPKHEVEEIMSSQEVKRSSGSRDLVPNDPYIEFLDMKACKLVRRYGDKLVEATMKPGDDGFAIAWFGDESIVTEMPNLMLEPVVFKRPAAKQVKKKPAAAAQKDDESISDGIASPSSSCSSKHEADAIEPACTKKTAKAEPLASFTKENFKFDSLSFGQCKAEFYSQKSYIRFFDLASKKWMLLVGTQGDNHHQKLEALVPHVKKANMNKHKIVALRDASK